MKVLVATHHTQGAFPGDYSWTVEGELVSPVAVECDSADRCGCGRGFPGLASSRATTTAVVADRPELDQHTLRDLVSGWLEREGWADLLDPADFVDMVDEHVECMRIVCSSFPVGTVLCRWGTRVFARDVGRAAA